MKKTFYSKRLGKRSTFDSVVAGASTVNIEQSMRYSRRRFESGSLGKDWKAVREDLADAIENLNCEFEAA